MRHHGQILIHLLIASLACPSATFAKNSGTLPPKAEQRKKFKEEEKEIPQKPSTPVSIPKPPDKTYFACKRTYTYAGKTLACDSPTQADGEKLRSLLQEVPAAAQELDTYQLNQRNLNQLAYLSSLGLAIALVGYIMNRPAFDQGKIKPGGYLVISGLGLSAGSFVYGLSLNSANESHLKRGIELYNEAFPEKTIQLQLNREF